MESNEELDKVYEEINCHPTYEELGHCYFERDVKTCHIEEEIGDFDARCKNCPRKLNYQIKLF